MNNQEHWSSPGMGTSDNVRKTTITPPPKIEIVAHDEEQRLTPPTREEQYSALSALETEVVGKTRTKRTRRTRETRSSQRPRNPVISTGVSSTDARRIAQARSHDPSSPYLQEPVPSSPGQRMEDWLAVHEEIAMDAEVEHARPQETKSKTSYFWWWCPIGLVLIGVLIVLVVILTSRNGGSETSGEDNPKKAFRFDVIRDCFEASSADSSAFSQRYRAFQDVIATKSVGDVTKLDQPNSPQRMALCWMSDFDAMSPSLQPDHDEVIVLQRYGMAVFYFALADESTNGLGRSNWLSDEQECTWRGVSCTVQTGTTAISNSVTRIILANSSLRGHVPPEIGDIQTLVFLLLGRNQIESLPSTIYDMSLRMFSVENNLIHSPIPTEIGKLTHLRVLSLADNDIPGAIPTEMGQLTGLLELYLRGNVLDGTFPSELGQLRDLGQLVLSPNRIRGSIPSEIGNLRDLEKFDISQNSFTGSIPPEISSLSSLSYFDGASNGLSGPIPSEIGLLTSLTTLVLAGNFLTSTIPGTALSLLSNLEHLGLANNNLSGPIPSELGLLSALEHVVLSHSNLSGAVPSELGLLDNAQQILLTHNNLVGSVPAEICSLRRQGNLQDLEVDCAGGDTAQVVCPSTCCTYCTQKPE